MPTLPKASRDPVDRISEDMLKTPLKKLSPAQWGMIRRALKGGRAEELLSRLKHEMDEYEVIG